MRTLFLIALLIPSIAFSDSPKCIAALSACQELVVEQDASIALLKQQVSTLEDRLSNVQPISIFPSWLMFTVGIIAGSVTTLVITR